MDLSLLLHGLLYLISVFAGKVFCRGGTGNNINEGKTQTPDYPSLKLSGQKLEYYKSYFTPSGRQYAKTQLDSPRTKTTCTNKEPYEDGELLETIPCPMDAIPDHYSYCCGSSIYEYCCRRQDTTQFKLMVALSAAGSLAGLIVIAVLVRIAIGSKRDKMKQEAEGKQKMKQLGIPYHIPLKTGGYSSKQREDGYEILVKFKSNYYNLFCEELCITNPGIAWRYNSDKSQREGKITMPDGGWVSLILTDKTGTTDPTLRVAREKSAVEWMDQVFIGLCSRIKDDSSCCTCFGAKGRTHPSQDYSQETQDSCVEMSDETILKEHTGRSQHQKGKHLDIGDEYCNMSLGEGSQPSLYDPEVQSNFHPESSAIEDSETEDQRNMPPQY